MPERMCVSCGKKSEKSSFIRISGKLELQSTGNVIGRSAYVCRNRSCIQKLSNGKTRIGVSLKRNNIKKEELIKLSNEILTKVINGQD
ncbi:MAG TPA: YlxR family protein [Caldisericia bacterium]|mgnify:FL=1|nr:YlxR family protein [Caldisericia bacterium]